METLQPAKVNIDLLNSYVAYLDRGENTTRSYLVCLRQFAAYLAFRGIDKPTRETVIQYRDYLLSEHDAIQIEAAAPYWSYQTENAHKVRITCKPATVQLYLTALKQFFAWTEDNGLYPNITKNVKAPKVSRNHKKEALTPADVAKIETMLKERIRSAGNHRKEEQARRMLAIFQLEVVAGLRNIEISRARIRDLEVINNQAYLYVWGKGQDAPEERIPLAPGVYETIRDYLQIRFDKAPNAPLFPATGNRSGGQAIAPRTISTMIKNILKAAGYDSERITAHSLRHTAATTAMQLTGDIYKTQKYLRHANPATTEIYLHVNDDKANAETADAVYKAYHSDEEPV